MCPYPPHKEKGFHHNLKDCKDCSKNEKDRIFDELRVKKRDGIKRASAKKKTEAQSSALFSATFGNKVRTTVFADIGADETLMDSVMLAKMRDEGLDITIEKVEPPRTFNMEARNPDGSATTISCDQVVTIYTQLHIRHGSAHILRGLRWLVTPQAVEEPLLGHPVLESLGPDCHKVLTGAAERLGGNVDISTVIGNQEDFGNGRIGRVLEGVFHADGRADDADLDDNDG